MQGRRHVDVRSESVVRPRTIVAGSERSDLHGTGEATTPGEVHLYDVALAFGDQATVVFEAVLLLTRGNPNSGCLAQLTVAFVIVGTEGLFQPEWIVWFECLRPLNGCLGVPGQTGIHHQVEIVTEAGTCFCYQRYIGL